MTALAKKEPTPPVVYASFDPDEAADDVPRVLLNGWIKVKSYRRGIEVLNVATVRVNSRYMLQIIEHGKEDFPTYIDGFPWTTIQVIAEHEAIAWLEEHR
jgi:hypothetical protein